MTRKNTIAFALALVATSAVASSALAACPNEVAVFLFDESNSMNDPGATGAKKTALSIEMANNYLTGMSKGSPVAVMGFGNSTQWGPDYLRTIAPFSAGYSAGNSTASIQAAFATATAQTVPGTYWTPLSGAVCDAVDSVTIDATDAGVVDVTCLFPEPGKTQAATALQIYLMTDGAENSTPNGTISGLTHECAGPESANGTAFNASQANWGLTPNSWQWHMASKAMTSDANTPVLEDGMLQVILNVSLLFAKTNSLGGTSGLDGQGPVTSELQDTTPTQYDTFVGSLAAATGGTYYESKLVNGAVAKLPLAGDTDPTPTYSCVNRADTARVIEAMGKIVTPADNQFDISDLQKRDVNHDLAIDSRDYQLVVKQYGKCAS